MKAFSYKLWQNSGSDLWLIIKKIRLIWSNIKIEYNYHSITRSKLSTTDWLIIIT